MRGKKVSVNRLGALGLLFHTCGQNTRGVGMSRFALQTLHTHTYTHQILPTHFSSCTCACTQYSGHGRSVSLAMLPVPATMTPGFSSLLKTLERQKMSVDSMKRPLMMAALNGLYVARMPVPEGSAEDSAKIASDERVRFSFLMYIFLQIYDMTKNENKPFLKLLENYKMNSD